MGQHATADGLDIMFVSRTLGHSNPSITLNVYGHLFDREQHAERAPEAMDAAIGDAVSNPLRHPPAYLGQSVAATPGSCTRAPQGAALPGRPGAKVWLRHSELDAHMEANRG